MKKEKTDRTEHFYNARKRLVLAGLVTLAVPLTGFGSLVAINGIKELVKEHKVQKELKQQYAESDEACEVSSMTEQETEENTSEENQQVEETKEES